MIETFQFPFPKNIKNSEILEVYNVFEKKIANIKNENIKLKEIIGYILPKLMSGEIRVNEAIEMK